MEIPGDFTLFLTTHQAASWLASHMEQKCLDIFIIFWKQATLLLSIETFTAGSLIHT